MILLFRLPAAAVPAAAELVGRRKSAINFTARHESRIKILDHVGRMVIWNGTLVTKSTNEREVMLSYAFTTCCLKVVPYGTSSLAISSGIHPSRQPTFGPCVR